MDGSSVMKLTLPLAVTAIALCSTHGALANSIIYRGNDAGETSIVYRGSVPEAALEDLNATAKLEMRTQTRGSDTMASETPPLIDVQETASTTPTPTTVELPEIIRTEDPISGRDVREISLGKQEPVPPLEITASGPEAPLENDGAEAPGSHATTPADLEDDAASLSEDTESPDSAPSFQ